MLVQYLYTKGIRKQYEYTRDDYMQMYMQRSDISAPKSIEWWRWIIDMFTNLWNICSRKEPQKQLLLK